MLSALLLTVTNEWLLAINYQYSEQSWFFCIRLFEFWCKYATTKCCKCSLSNRPIASIPEVLFSFYQTENTDVILPANTFRLWLQSSLGATQQHPSTIHLQTMADLEQRCLLVVQKDEPPPTCLRRLHRWLHLGSADNAASSIPNSTQW